MMRENTLHCTRTKASRAARGPDATLDHLINVHTFSLSRSIRMMSIQVDTEGLKP